jgi:hypothetical protein
MDYGRRVYGTKSNNYITFMSEITDKYVQSIGGKFTAGIKQPYLYDDYFSMQYLYNSRLKYLGGKPAASLEALGLDSTITPSSRTLNTAFSVNFDGTYADSVSGLSPAQIDGNTSLTTYGGKSCVRLNDAGLGTSRIFWYPVSNINKQSFSMSWEMVGGLGDVPCGIAGGPWSGTQGSIEAGVAGDGGGYVYCTDASGVELINYKTPTSYYTDSVWNKFNITFHNGILNVQINNNIILTQALDITFNGTLTTIVAAAVLAGVYFDSIKVENVTG